jgi:hypothetical protein
MLERWAASLLAPELVRISLAESEDKDLARCIVLAELAWWRWTVEVRVCLLIIGDSIPSRRLMVRDELVACRVREPLPSANFEATIDEVFLLWASAFAAASRRASATREIVGRLRQGVVVAACFCCWELVDDLAVLKEEVFAEAWPSVEWRLAPMVDWWWCGSWFWLIGAKQVRWPDDDEHNCWLLEPLLESGETLLPKLPPTTKLDDVGADDDAVDEAMATGAARDKSFSLRLRNLKFGVYCNIL